MTMRYDTNAREAAKPNRLLRPSLRWRSLRQ